MSAEAELGMHRNVYMSNHYWCAHMSLDGGWRLAMSFSTALQPFHATGSVIAHCIPLLPRPLPPHSITYFGQCGQHSGHAVCLHVFSRVMGLAAGHSPLLMTSRTWRVPCQEPMPHSSQMLSRFWWTQHTLHMRCNWQIKAAPACLNFLVTKQCLSKTRPALISGTYLWTLHSPTRPTPSGGSGQRPRTDLLLWLPCRAAPASLDRR